MRGLNIHWAVDLEQETQSLVPVRRVLESDLLGQRHVGVQ